MTKNGYIKIVKAQIVLKKIEVSKDGYLHKVIG